MSKSSDSEKKSPNLDVGSFLIFLLSMPISYVWLINAPLFGGREGDFYLDPPFDDPDTSLLVLLFKLFWIGSRMDFAGFLLFHVHYVFLLICYYEYIQSLSALSFGEKLIATFSTLVVPLSIPSYYYFVGYAPMLDNFFLFLGLFSIYCLSFLVLAIAGQIVKKK